MINLFWLLFRLLVAFIKNAHPDGDMVKWRLLLRIIFVRLVALMLRLGILLRTDMIDRLQFLLFPLLFLSTLLRVSRGWFFIFFFLLLGFALLFVFINLLFQLLQFLSFLLSQFFLLQVFLLGFFVRTPARLVAGNEKVELIST